ncbi:hypothetical protein BpHYR1_023717 [Brachionus plicatilis]|uniref:Uncharacterized protein n=1 Tax=Brachionus plicatilis TaxID=10195 RepID=A0A3M7RU17_BRAPC|nr:hypothetical protein BpHYR1_023717 [Brachionus plicatilis]
MRSWLDGMMNASRKFELENDCLELCRNGITWLGFVLYFAFVADAAHSAVVQQQSYVVAAQAHRLDY